jgi:NAD-dependent deacetylase
MNKVIILSGAGLSASSGISTFRDSGGLWEEYDIKDICSAGCLDTNQEQTIEFYNKRREDIKDKQPNKAHHMIANIKKKYPSSVTVITQNVDDLLEKANCQDIIHLHGFLPEIICEQCSHITNIGYNPQNTDDTCHICGGRLRPNIVFFGEPAPRYQDLNSAFTNDNLLLVVIGTSGYVIDVSYYARCCEYSILNNLEKSDAINDEIFTKVYYEDAPKVSSKIEGDIEKFIQLGKLS